MTSMIYNILVLLALKPIYCMLNYVYFTTRVISSFLNDHNTGNIFIALVCNFSLNINCFALLKLYNNISSDHYLNC